MFTIIWGLGPYLFNYAVAGGPFLKVSGGRSPILRIIQSLGPYPLCLKSAGDRGEVYV